MNREAMKAAIDVHGKAMLRYGEMLHIDDFPEYRKLEFAREKQKCLDNAQDTRKIIHKMIDSL